MNVTMHRNVRDVLYHRPVLVCAADVFINRWGLVKKRHYTFIPAGVCDIDRSNPSMKVKNDTYKMDRIVGKVFVLAQPIGDAYFHAVIENAVRLSAYYEELLEDNCTKVFIVGKLIKDILRFLGFKDDRFVEGNVFAKLMLFPEPSQLCGTAGVEQVITFRKILFQRLASMNLTTNSFSDSNQSPIKSDKANLALNVVMVYRRRRRIIRNYNELVNRIREKFPFLVLLHFRDGALPSVAKALSIFYNASFIIAPHGAGLANIIAARKGTVVIEYMTDDEYMSSVFSTLARQLQLRYYATVSAGSRYWGHVIADIDATVNILEENMQKLISGI